MRTTIAVCIFVLVARALSAQDRVIKGQEPAWPPASGKATFILHPSRRSQVRSLQELIDAAQIIVDATVQQALPARVLPHRLETDVVLSTNRVIKGPGTLTAFVVSEPGGVVGGFTEESRQYSMMQTGEHYLIFGREEDRTTLPPVGSSPRYEIVGIWVGGVRIDNVGRVHFAQASPPIFQQYEGILVSELIRQIMPLLP
jgi:hypothetical protein